MLFLAAAIWNLSTIHAQVNLQVFTVSGGPTANWSLRNAGNNDVKLVAVTMRFFHHRPNIDFLPLGNIQMFNKNQYDGRFMGNSKTYRYKTICGFAQDSLLAPSAQIGLIAVENYNTTTPDSILAAGITVYCKVNGKDTVVEAYPGGIAPCPGKHLFLSAGLAASGLKEGSFAASNKVAGSCEKKLNMVIYDGQTLQQKGVGITPRCPNGRKWSTYGFSADSLLYYSFDITAKSGRMALDSVVNAMNDGDYCMMGNANPTPLYWFDSCVITLKKLGWNNSGLSNQPGYMLIVGRKGLNPGKARFSYCSDAQSNCQTAFEQTIVAGTSTQDMWDFGSCFEAYEQVLEKGMEINATSKINQAAILAFPNPSSTVWQIITPKTSAVSLLGMDGKTIDAEISKTETGLQIDAANLPLGSYIAELVYPNGKKQRVSLMRL
jgi:hypothetical protein